MMITTKGRNALKIMIDLVKHDKGSPVSLSEIAERVKESVKYLEPTVAALVAAGLVSSTRGKSGGYRLTRLPNEYTVGEIICAAEGSLSPVSCLDEGCENACNCPTLPLWRELDDVIMSFLNGKTLDELVK